MSSTNNARNTTVSDQTNRQKCTSMKTDLGRLSTFASINGDIHSTLSKGVLANMGFIYAKDDNIIQCVDCGFTSELSVCVDELIEKHLKHNDKCPSILNVDNVYRRKGILISIFIN